MKEKENHNKEKGKWRQNPQKKTFLKKEREKAALQKSDL